MQAITKYYGLEQAIEKSINAGIDILLFSNNQLPKNQVMLDTVISIIKEKVKTGTIKADRIYESFNRIKKLKQKIGLII